MTTYVIKYKGQPNTYNRGVGFEATLEEATLYKTRAIAEYAAEDFDGVEGIYEYEVELARLKLSWPQPNFVTREQLIVAIQNATDVFSIYDDRGEPVRSIRYVDPTFLIKALQELS